MVIESTKLNQWKNTDIVTEWFKNILFDIENFYPSASPELFNKSIDFAKSICNISDNVLKIIINARKTLLFHLEEPWMRKNGEEYFDVLMGCHDGVEICEFVGTFILNQISLFMKEQNNVGLYRDDGFGYIQKFVTTRY